jgi:hypothetical protein
MDVIKTLVPYVFSTHVKDMALEEYVDGFLLSEVPLGTGYIRLASNNCHLQKTQSECDF